MTAGLILTIGPVLLMVVALLLLLNKLLDLILALIFPRIDEKL